MDVDRFKPKEFNLTISDFAGDGEDAGASGGSWKLDAFFKSPSNHRFKNVRIESTCFNKVQHDSAMFNLIQHCST